MDRDSRLKGVDEVTGTRGSRSYTLRWVALDKRVLLVAVSSGNVNHGAYIGAVRGENYDEEALEVAANGSAVSDLFAEVYFKDIASGPLKPLREAEPYFDDERLKIGFAPSNPDILDAFRVDKHVLLVAVRAPGNTWKAFIGAVKGEDYWTEATDVVKTGTPIPFELAEVCFHDLAGGEKWHEKLRVYFDGVDYGPAEDWKGGKPARPARKRG